MSCQRAEAPSRPSSVTSTDGRALAKEVGEAWPGPTIAPGLGDGGPLSTAPPHEGLGGGSLRRGVWWACRPELPAPARPGAAACPRRGRAASPTPAALGFVLGPLCLVSGSTGQGTTRPGCGGWGGSGQGALMAEGGVGPALVCTRALTSRVCGAAWSPFDATSWHWAVVTSGVRLGLGSDGL